MGMRKRLWVMITISGLLISSAGISQENRKPDKKVLGSVSWDAKLLDINNIECWVSNRGGFGENPSTGSNGFYYPKGQRSLTMIYTPEFLNRAIQRQQEEARYHVWLRQ